jgi:hypothetical protein
VARGETIVSKLKLATALSVRDSFVKSLYSRMFSWLVERMSEVMSSGMLPTDGDEDVARLAEADRKAELKLRSEISAPTFFLFFCFALIFEAGCGII